MIGYPHFVTVKWICEEHNNLFSSSLIPLRVSLCTVMDCSGRYSMNPRGALWRSVSDESPGRWQGVITERKTLRYKKSKRDKEDWYLSSGHTWKHASDSITVWSSLFFALPTLYFPLSASYNLTVTPLLLHFFFPLFTSGIYVNKSHLSSCCDPSIITRDQFKITVWEQKEWG